MIERMACKVAEEPEEAMLISVEEVEIMHSLRTDLLDGQAFIGSVDNTWHVCFLVT